jgi:hypothetical protein
MPIRRGLNSVPSWWTPGLGGQKPLVSPFEFNWAEVAERRMAPPTVIEILEILKDGGTGVGASPPLNLINEFELEAGKETFGNRVSQQSPRRLMLARSPC